MAQGLPVSPLAPKGGFPDLPVVKGVRFATVEAGVKYTDRADVMLAVCDDVATVAGVFTTSKTCSAAVTDCRSKLGKGGDGPTAILVNSGNANAFTGISGQAAVDRIVEATSLATGAPSERIFTASTGVIGEPLPYDRITAALDTLAANAREGSIADAARAIMTTDTFPKGAGCQIKIAGKTVSISGIAKGSGMIAPDMATMLVYIFTDAWVDFDRLQEWTAELADQTFNRITVDTDTSTSDTLLVVATDGADVDVIGEEDEALFRGALHDVMRNLAHQVVRDGEGATKFVTVKVSGAVSDTDATLVARSIANSPLVKTAVAGEDPNWGRVVMAVGKSGAEADRDRLAIQFGDVSVAENGQVHPDYVEANAAEHMKQEEVTISVDLGLGSGQDTVWTCDLTAQYIAINADYRS
ncbi:MAG: bifunctional glutamate N-acetyltransferase/amino-acid acetyltransferase ArgJ [Pseudomonadota bacterium]